MKGWEKRQANEKARYRNKKVEERRENDWLSKTRQSYPHVSVRPSVRFSAPPLSAGKYLHRLFALCCGRNEIALESPSLFTADLHRRPPPSVCPRGANYDSPLSICQHGYLVARRGGPLLLSKPSRKLLFAHSSSPRGPLRLALRLAFPHASSILSRPTGICFSFQPMPSFFPFSFHARIFRENFFFFFEFLSFPFQFFVLQIANKFFFFSFLFKFKILLGKSVEKISRLCFSSRSFCRFFFSRPITLGFSITLIERSSSWN